MSQYTGSGGSSSSRRTAPSYQTSSSSRKYSSTGASDRDYSRSHLSSNGGSRPNYYSSSSTSRKPESGTTGYSYLEPDWIEKTRSSLPVDPYSSSYLDRRAPLSRDCTTAAAVQPVYPSAAAAALSDDGSYRTSSTLPKAYAGADDFYRAPPSALVPTAAESSDFEQSTMAAQAAALYEMQAAAMYELQQASQEEKKREEGRREERRDRERDVSRDRNRRPSVPSRDRNRDSDSRVAVSSSSRRDDHRREVKRAETTSVPRGARHEYTRGDGDFSDARDTKDGSRRRPVDDAKLDRKTRDLARQLAEVQRELKQLREGGRSRERESDRSRRPSSPPLRGRGKTQPPRSGLSHSSSIYHRMAAERASRHAGRGRTGVLPSLLDMVVSRPGRRSAPAASRSVWETPVRRGVAPPSRPPATNRIAGYEYKRTTTRGRGEALSSREKVRRAKEKMRREDEERKRRMEKRKEGRDERSKESREKRKEEDFAWLESMMSEDEELESMISEDEELEEELYYELDEETNRQLLLDGTAHTLDNLDSKKEAGAAVEDGEERVLWTAEECEAIELLPLIDTMDSVESEVAGAFLSAHPDPDPHSNGNEEMEE